MRRVVLLFCVGLLACPKKPPPKPPPPPPDPKAELKAAIASLYASLETQEPERLAELLTPDVLAYGPGPKDSYVSRDTLIDTVRQELIPFGLRGDVFKLTGSNPIFSMTSSEGSGWFTDFPRLQRARQERSAQLWSLRVTGHAVRDGDRWRFDAVHVSLGWPDAELYAPDAVKRLKLPEAFGETKAFAAEEIIALTRRMLSDIAFKIDRTSDSEQTVLIGTDPGDVFEGGAKFKTVARAKLPELKKAEFVIVLEEDPRARVAPDGLTAWTAGRVVMQVGRGPKAQVLPPFRALWVYAREKDSEPWSLVSEHQSLGLPAELRQQSAPGVADAGE